MIQLLQTAQALAVSDDATMDAQDADDPKAALRALIAQARREIVGNDSDEESVHRAQLEGMRTRELLSRAKDCGIGEEALRAAKESEHPKLTVVELLQHRKPQ